MVNRNKSDRRTPDRRSFSFAAYRGGDRRQLSRRAYLDRRSAEFWRFSWLRVTLAQQLAG